MALREDPRNGAYRMAAKKLHLVEDLEPHSKVWDMPRHNRIDQGREGMCVGAATAHWFGSELRPERVNYGIAMQLYKLAQKHDEWAGENYEGTSVNGMMKALSTMGYIGPYYWVKNFNELIRTLCFYGPVIMGSEWREGCFTPNHKGYITFEGETMGGHATCIRILDMENRRFGIQQSWGDDHGDDSLVWMRFEDMEKLLETHPQIVFPEKLNTRLATIKPKPWWKFWKS